MITTIKFVFLLNLIIITLTRREKIKENSKIYTIGILTQPTLPNFTAYENYSYIHSSYINDLKNAGASIIPIKYTWPLKKIEKVAKKINGLFLTGGFSSIKTASLLDLNEKLNKTRNLTVFAQKAKFLIDFAIKENKKVVEIKIFLVIIF